MNRRILVVEDDRKTAELIKLYLQRDNYKVFCAYDGKEAIELVAKIQPVLIILDLMLPKLDGWEVCRLIRKESDVPIIMLTARVAEEDKLLGLELGADDYITKPFSLRELVARVRAILRRVHEQYKGPDEISVGDLVLKFSTHQVIIAGKVLSLTPTEFKLLGVLARQPGKVFTRLELIEKALGYDCDSFERTIDAHIVNLRKKIEPDPGKPRYIKTVYGVGYKFESG